MQYFSKITEIIRPGAVHVFVVLLTRFDLKELPHGWRILKKMANFFSQVRHSQSVSSTILVPVWFIITSLVFFFLSKLLFQGFFHFEGDFALCKNDLKYCDIAISINGTYLPYVMKRDFNAKRFSALGIFLAYYKISPISAL